MRTGDPTVVLDREQLREITLEDPDLMREIVAALIEDTSRQLALLDAAIRGQDAPQCIRLAHYSKGACANVGANTLADLLKTIEGQARSGNFAECGDLLAALDRGVERLRVEFATL